jgi:hypothetical protein
MDTNEVRKIVGNKIFSAVFTKKDGSTRKMLCKLGVKKHLKGGKKSYDTESLNHLTVYSLDSSGYRTINLNTLKSIKCGKVYKV